MKKILNGLLMAVVLVALGFSMPLRPAAVDAAVPYINTRINISSAGAEANGMPSAPFLTTSKDGRYVAFATDASNLVAGDTNGKTDVFVRDRVSNTTTRVSVSSVGVEANGHSNNPVISPNGRYIVFNSGATNLAPEEGMVGYTDLFLHDRVAGTTEIVSLTSTGGLPNGGGNITRSAVSLDGRYVAFASAASNIVPSDTNGKTDIFVRDRKLNTTTLVSRSDTGVISNSGATGQISMSCDGAVIAFVSESDNLVSNDTNGQGDIFVVNRVGGHEIRNITIDANGYSLLPNVSCDGSTIAFQSTATNLVSDDTNGIRDLFILDAHNVISRANVSSTGAEANDITVDITSVSGDGRYVSFESIATNLVSDDTNGQSDVFIHDRDTGITERVSMRSSGVQTTGSSWHGSMSANGETIIYFSVDTGLVAGDTNGMMDIFAAETGKEPCDI